MADTTGCRILVISPTMEQSQQFVQRVKALTSCTETDLSSADASSNSVPWTIANKYYTAEVHFETWKFQDFRVHHAVGVPAVIYVWSHGEPYQEHVPDIAKSLEHYEPEVSLAVRFGGNLAAAADEVEGPDEFLSSHGFEFIEGDRSFRRPTQAEGRVSDDEDQGVPGLPRVVDALSTIMWPSLVQSDATRQRKSRARELLDWAREEEVDDGLRSLLSSESVDTGSTSAQHSPVITSKKSRMQREMDELERWLEDEDEKHEAESARAWQTGWLKDDGAAEVETPTILTPTADGQGAMEYKFDDDFTDFVSAPSRRPSDAIPEPARLVPMHTGASYRSLGSMSDMGDTSYPYHTLDQEIDDDDPDLPSRAEIAETSHKIFGSALSPNSHAPRRMASFTSSTDLNDQSFEQHDDDDFEVSAFDLSRVLGALQDMKQEIAGMGDESERRKAAARVALGLVYGLQADRDDDRVL